MDRTAGLARRTDADRAVARRLFVVFFLAYVLLTRGHFISTDEVAVYQTAQSMWEDGDLSIPPCFSAVKLPDGTWMSRYGIGQPLLSVPLYGLGKAARALCDATGADALRRALEQRRSRSGDTVWSGEPSIFFVMLLPCAAVAALCSGFWLLARRFAASRGAALAGTLLLGLASHPATFAGQYFQHALEAALLLWSFLFLVDDAAEPSWRRRAAAGAVAAMLVLTRIHGALALPMLGLYLLASAGALARPFDPAAMRRAAGRAVALAVPVALGLAGVLALNRMRFGAVSLTGRATTAGFDSSVLDGIWGLLLSPGSGVFVYTPALVLAVIAAPSFARRLPREAALIVLTALAYLVVHGAYRHWHGHSCIGPRYLAAVVPLLLLMLPPWLDPPRRGRRLAFALAFTAGLVVTLLQVLVNYWKVLWSEKLNPFTEGVQVLFVPSRAQLLAHARALMTWDGRVEFWLRECWQQAGPAWAVGIASLLVVALVAASWRVRQAWALSDSWVEEPARSRRRVIAAVAAIAIVALATESGRRVDAHFEAAAARQEAAAAGGFDAEMAAGLDLLWKEGKAEEAATRFRRALELWPSHYGANFQMGVALEKLGRAPEAEPHFELVLERALEAGDANTESLTMQRLAAPERSTDAVMQQGLDALWLRKRPRAAAALFAEVLRRVPEHYGAIYQLGVALDRSGRREEARATWEKVAAKAGAYGDAKTLETATTRLAESD